jgi:hypothetical protein
VSGGRLIPNAAEVKTQWYDPQRNSANFVVLSSGVAGYPGFTRERAVLATFGPPARTYRVGSDTVLVWNKNLLSELS